MQRLKTLLLRARRAAKVGAVLTAGGSTPSDSRGEALGRPWTSGYADAILCPCLARLRDPELARKHPRVVPFMRSSTMR